MGHIWVKKLTVLPEDDEGDVFCRLGDAEDEIFSCDPAIRPFWECEKCGDVFVPKVGMDRLDEPPESDRLVFVFAVPDNLDLTCEEHITFKILDV